MLNIFGESRGTFCDQLSRRNFIKVGALGLGGLSLPQLLRAEQQAEQRGQRRVRCCLNCYLRRPEGSVLGMLPQANLPDENYHFSESLKALSAN